MACAEVLVANEVGGNRARFVFYGLAAGATFKLMTSWLKVIPDHLTLKIPFLRKGELGMDVSAALFGVGYILGPRVASIMVGGGLLSWLVIIPAIDWWGASRLVPLYPETQMLITDMSASQIWTRYVRYIGAGAVATAGILTLIRSLPLMLESFRVGARQLRSRVSTDSPQATPRTDRDLTLWVVGAGVIADRIVLAAVPPGLREPRFCRWPARLRRPV